VRHRQATYVPCGIAVGLAGAFDAPPDLLRERVVVRPSLFPGLPSAGFLST
jgi:hypothetical protein